MDDDPARPDPLAASPSSDQAVGEACREPGSLLRPGEDRWPQTIPLLEETAVVSKRRVVTGSLKIETRTELRQESADVELERQVVDITRIPIDRLIDAAPEVRTEGDTTIIPVVEERFVIVKQLFLKEELHIRHRTEPEIFQQPVALRRQVAVVERFDPEGRIIGCSEEPVSRSAVLSTSRIEDDAFALSPPDPEVRPTIVEVDKGEKPWTSKRY